MAIAKILVSRDGTTKLGVVHQEAPLPKVCGTCGSTANHQPGDKWCRP